MLFLAKRACFRSGQCPCSQFSLKVLLGMFTCCLLLGHRSLTRFLRSEYLPPNDARWHFTRKQPGSLHLMIFYYLIFGIPDFFFPYLKLTFTLKKSKKFITSRRQPQIYPRHQNFCKHSQAQFLRITPLQKTLLAAFHFFTPRLGGVEGGSSTPRNTLQNCQNAFF